MKHARSVLLLGIGFAVLVTFFSLRADRGIFDRGPAGSEFIYWGTAQAYHGGIERPQSLSQSIYPRLLQPLASEDPGALRRVRRIQTGLSLALLTLMTFLLARPRAGAGFAALAALAVPISAPFLAMAGSIDPGLMAGILGVSGVVVLASNESLVSRLIGGALVGVATWLLPTIGWTLAVVLFLGMAARSTKRRLLSSGLFALGWVGAALIVGATVSGEVRLPSVSGLEVYRGHRAQASGLQPWHGDQDEERWWTNKDYFYAALRDGVDSSDLSGIENYWLKRALRDIGAHPVSEIVRTGRKLVAAFQPDPIPSQVSFGFLVDQAEAPFLGLSRWVGRILLPLGLVGLILYRRRVGWILWLALAAGPLAMIWTYALPGLRLTTLVVMTVGLAFFFKALVEGRRVVAILAGTTAVLILGFLAPAVVPASNSIDSYLLGILHDRDGRGSAAMREYDRATRADAKNPLPRLALADMLGADQVYEEAIKELELVRVDHPNLTRPLESLAGLYQLRSRWIDAINTYRQLLEIAPANVEYVNNLGVTQLSGGYFQEAEASFRRALEIDPDHVAAKANLDGMIERGYAVGEADPETVGGTAQHLVTLIRSGEFAAADTALAKAYDRWGTDQPQLRFLDGTLRLQQGDCVASIRILESLIPVMRNQQPFLHNLATAYATCGDLERAIATWDDALKLNPNNERIRTHRDRAIQDLKGTTPDSGP